MKLRRVIFNLHLYIGLAAGLFLLLSGLTGSMIVFRDEIEGLTHPELMETAPGEKRIPVQAVLDTVKRAYPEDKLLYLRMPRTPQETYVLRMNSAHDLFVYVNPYNGELLGGHRQKDTFMGWIALVHTELLSGELGKNILGVSALLLICMCGTGLFLWWPPNGIRNISRGFKIGWSAPWKKFIFDVHRAFGAYTIIFLIIVAFTGVSLVFNKAVAELINSLTASAPRPSPPNSRVDEAADSIPSLDALLNHADHVLPAPTTWVTFPQTPQAPLVVRKRTPDEFNPNGRSFIYFDQYTGEVLLVENASNAPLGARIFNTFYPIHTGVIGGFPTRMVQVVMGLAPLFLFATGYMMWRNRRKARSYKNNSKVAYKFRPDRT
jgi:uncharacterized iron-regulated membrane protein